MEFIGRVVGTKMKNTAVVEVERLKIHPLYKKRIKIKKKQKVNDTIGVKIGNFVRIKSSRPISKDKHFEIIEVIKDATE